MKFITEVKEYIGVFGGMLMGSIVCLTGVFAAIAGFSFSYVLLSRPFIDNYGAITNRFMGWIIVIVSLVVGGAGGLLLWGLLLKIIIDKLPSRKNKEI